MRRRNWILCHPSVRNFETVSRMKNAKSEGNEIKRLHSLMPYICMRIEESQSHRTLGQKMTISKKLGIVYVHNDLRGRWRTG